jgi:hypothetical protein
VPVPFKGAARGSRAGVLLIAFLVLVSLAGCFDVTEEIWVNPDGSARSLRTIKVAASRLPGESTAGKVARLKQGIDAADAFFANNETAVTHYDATVKTDGADIVFVEDISVKDALALRSSQSGAAQLVERGSNDSLDRLLNYELEKSRSGGDLSFRFQLKPDASSSAPIASQALADAGYASRHVVVRLHGPILESNGTIDSSATTAEWTTTLADIVSLQVTPAEGTALVARGASGPGAAALVLIAAILLLGSLSLFMLWQRRTAAPPAGTLTVRPAQPASAPRPAPATPPSAAPGKGLTAVIPSADALLSDASEINVDTEGATAPARAPEGVVKFKCPKCEIELKVPLELAGREGKCRKCGGAFVSPVPPALKEARAQLAAAAAAASPPPPAAAPAPTSLASEPPSMRAAFSVQKVRCSCGMTSAVLKGRVTPGGETCPACGLALVV